MSETGADIVSQGHAKTKNGANLTAMIKRRMQERRNWDAYWKLTDVETRGTLFPRFGYLLHRFFDAPATWLREKIVEPLHDKYKLPYYHRRFTRVPSIDQCGVNDYGCHFEANEQYRFDKMVDYYILEILLDRMNLCTLFYGNDRLYKCIQETEDYEQNELNYFIKYGELGSEADVVDVYMKQKHRLIWERRNPEVMSKRQKDYEEYLDKKKNGEFDFSFWTLGVWFQNKKMHDMTYDREPQKPRIEGDVPLSKDWRYYKRLQEDPEFDKEQGKTSEFRFFPPI